MTNPNPYHVRLAISQYGDQFRAELFTEDLGDTEGKELLPSIKNLPVGNAQDGDATTFAQWLESLAGGQVAFDAEQLRNIGRVLFKYLLGSAENLEKWQAICAQATDQHRDIRLLIDATTPDTYDLPYGLLCEQNGKFLFQPESDRLAIQFVRILRQSTPRMLQLGRKPLRLLVVAAEPQGLEVGCANYLCQLLRGLGERYAVTLCDTEGTYPLPEVVTGSSDAWQPAQFTRFCRTTRTVLKRTLQGGTYDLLHVIAHGVGTGLIVCTADGARDEVTSGDFGNWCRASQIQLAFLQVCKSGQAGTRGAFGGIAQKLVSPQFGNLAAVVASPYPIDPAQSTQVAMQFYQRLLTEAELHPDLALWRSFPDDEGDWRLWALLELWVRPRALSDTGTRGYFQFPSPYRGLARFEERDAEIFFGRDAEILDLLNIISQEPVVAVVGDSGSGKSSLLQAGVCARMRRDGPEIGTDWSKSVDPSKRTDWRIVSLTPGEKPAQSLVLALGGPTPDQPDEAALRQAFAQVRQAAQPLLLVFDQFEELFTLCDNPAERQAVSTVLAEEAQQHLDQFRLILGMRSEYLGAAAKLPGLNARISRPWLLKFPDASNVQAIVAQPAYYHGYTFENGLLAKILTDPLLTTGAAPLPLLEFALERLWLKAVERGSQEFTHKDYDDLGGMVGAIARHADEVYEYLPTSFSELGTAAQHVAEQILTGLVTTSGTRHTRRPRPRHGLEVETGNPELARQVLDRLVGERLLTLRRNPNQPDDALVDLSHEVLLTRWEKLQQWLALDPEGRAMKEAFQKDLDRWAQGLPDTPAKSPQLLPNADVVATDYLAWIDSKKPTLTPAQKDFTDELRNLLRRKAEVEEEQRRKQEEQRQQKLEAAQKLAAAEAQARQEAEQRVAEQKKSNQRLRRRAFGLVVVFLIAVVAAIVAVNLAIKTVRQTQIAQINEIEALTQTSKALFLSHDELGALLVGIKAGKSAKQAGAPTILISQISAVLQEVVYGVHEKNRLEGHTSTSDVYTVALSPDGATLALGGEDQTIRLWRIADGQELRTFRGHSERVLSVAFSPDGATLASSSADRTIKLWRIADGQELKTFRGHSERVLSVAFNPLDGTILASGSADKTIKLWRIAADMAFKTFRDILRRFLV